MASSSKTSDVEAHYVVGASHPPARRIKLGNPGPLGLFSFASTTLILSLYNVNARGIDTPNVVVGMALFCGGLAQFLAGMWEFATGNTFGATAFTSYGAFWLSFATLFIPGSGIADAYAASADPAKETDAIAIYLTSWMIVTFLFFIGSLRKSVGLSVLFFSLTITFMLLAVADYQKNANIGKAGGGFGILTAFIAYYCGLAELLTDEDIFTIPLGKYPPKMA
ncbi:GPR1/FUN34/yaaH family-domain-containing protein [Gloeopeniophorella convolvens]|nr:GPR1/FUN34/yaaH family-domain-containing protein [Gloeopeniophorella convolvens]